MSSFNVYDNYSSFNDLINRAEFLEEKDFKSMVGSAKLRPEFAKYKAKDPKTGEKASPGGLSRLANILFVTALGEAHLDILDQETTNTLKGAKYSTSSTRIGQGLQELAPKAFEELFREKNPRSVEVSEYVNDPEKLEELIKDTVINYTRRDREYIKDIDTEDIADAVEDAVDDISDEVKIAQGLMSSGADQVELDFDDVDVNIEALDNKDEVAAKIAQLINTTNNLKAEPTGVGLNIEGPVGVFGSEEKVSDQMTRLITKYFPAVREAEIKVTLNTDQEEDYEEGPEPLEPEGPANEYEEDINDAEEDAEYKGKFSPKYAKKVEKEFENHVRLRSPDGKLGVKLPPGNKDEIEDYKKRGYVEDNEFDDFDIGPQSDENVPDDYEDVLAALVDDDKKKHAIKQLNREDGEDSYDFLGDDDFLPSGDREEIVALKIANKKAELRKEGERIAAGDEEGGMRLKELEIGGHRYEVGVDDPHDDGIVIDIEKNKNGYTITGAVYSDPMDYYEDPNDMKEGYRYGIDQDGKYIGAPGGVGRINEAIKMQPHLEVSETSTAAYLTEQKQSDKRNKKAEVKNQSFKEKYKPKTHWQLEELRRYGL